MIHYKKKNYKVKVPKSAEKVGIKIHLTNNKSIVAFPFVRKSGFTQTKAKKTVSGKGYRHYPWK